MASEPFQAFISYSRGASQPLAIDLQTGLERFAKPWYRLRAMRIFRDDSSMAANTALWSTIETGLKQAGWFILLATPASAASQYVNAEIDWWLRNKGPQRLLIVQAEGELVWDRVAGRFHPASTAVPPILHDAYPEEPRWIDLRWYAADPKIAKSDPRFAERIADLASAVRGVERDTLVGDNVRQHRRALRLARGAVTVLAILLVLSIVASILAVGQRNTARDQTRIAQARQLAATASTLAQTDIGKARLLAVQAYRLAPELSTQSALFASLMASPQLVREFDAGSRVWNTAGTADGRTVIAATDEGTISAWDVTTGTRTTIGELGGQPGDLAASADGSVIIGRNRDDRVAIFVGGQEIPLPDGLPAGAQTVGLSPSGNVAVVAYGEPALPINGYVLRRDGQTFRRSPVTLHFGAGAFRFTVLDDDTVSAQLFPSSEGRIERRSLRTGELLASGGGGSSPLNLATSTSADGRYIAIPEGSNTGTMPIYRTDRGASRVGHPDLIGYIAGTNDPQTALSPDGSVSAYAENDIIFVAPTQRPGSTPFAVTQLRGIARTGVNSLTFLSNRFLVSGSDDRLLVWDLDQGTSLATAVASQVPAVANALISRELVANPSGTSAVLVDSFGGFTVIDAATGAVRTGNAETRFVAWRDDSSFFYADSPSRQLRRFDVSTGTDLGGVAFDWPTGSDSTTYDVWTARYLADRDQLLIAGRHTVAVVDPTTGQLVSRRDDLSYPSFAADGSQVFGLPDPAAPVGAVSPPGGGALTTIPTAPLDFDSAASEQNGLQKSGYQSDVLVTQELGSVRRVFWSTDGRQRLGDAPAGNDAAGYRIAVSPDDRWYAVHRTDATVEITELRSGSSLGLLPLRHDNDKISFGYAGDGRRLLVALPADADPSYPKGMILSVDLRVDEWIAIACRTAGRDLTAEEWTALTGSEPPTDLRCR